MMLLHRLGGFGQSQVAAEEAHGWLSAFPRDQLLNVLDCARACDDRAHLAALDSTFRHSCSWALRTAPRIAVRNSLAECIEDAEFQVIDGGDLLHIDSPEGVKNAIIGFLIGRLWPADKPQVS